MNFLGATVKAPALVSTGAGVMRPLECGEVVEVPRWTLASIPGDAVEVVEVVEPPRVDPVW